MEVLQQIEQVLEERIRPMLRSHGGEISVADFREGVLYVSLTGACAGCPSADLSTKGFIEEELCGAIPEVREVELEQTVSSELMDFARKLLRHEED